MIIDPSTTFKTIIDIRKSIKAELIDINLLKTKDIAKALIDLENEYGVSVDVNEIEKYADGSLLGYQGHQAILYISDTGKTSDYLLNNELLRTSRRSRNSVEEKSPKFHFSWCKTLEDMHSKGRYDRYVMLRNKDNLFKVQAKEDRYGDSFFLDESVKLYVCKNCLEGNLGHEHSIGYKGYRKNWSYREKIQAVEDFSIKDFLNDNESLFNEIRNRPKYNDSNIPENNYSKDFPEISRSIRESKNWTCEECFISMDGMKRGLHTHHKNGNKFDNSIQNLEVICAECHKEHHPNMTVPEDVMKYISQMRNNL